MMVWGEEVSIQQDERDGWIREATDEARDPTCAIAGPRRYDDSELLDVIQEPSLNRGIKHYR